MEYIGQFYYLFSIGLGFLHTCRSFPVDPKDTEVAIVNAFSETWPVIVSLSILFLIVSVVLLAGCLCCRGTNGFKVDEDVVKEEIKEFRNSVSSTNLTGVGIGYVNSNLSGSQGGGNELAIFPPPGVNTASVTFEPLPNIVPPSQQQPQITRNKPPLFNTSPSQDFSVADWFVKEANFPREQLHYLRECGRGWFGRVVEGEARNVDEGGRSCKVVVRILREDATPSEQKFFLNEVKPFRDLSHPNIVKLVGRCLDTEPFLILLESCSSGDLKSFLCGNVASRSALCEQGICLRMMCDVAAGLQHMHENGFVHTDLAARNCLVTSDLTVKVGDYGTSIETYKDDYYIAGDMAIPIRWCSPESLYCTDTIIETKQVTASANVWSFSVLLWEVCEFGALPYTSLSDEQVIVRVLGKEGLKLPHPTYPSLHSQHLYSLMQMCWRDTKERATLDHVIAMLRHLQVTRTLDSEDNFERRWETLKPNTIPVTDNQKLDAVTLKSDFDSGVDLDAKSADLDISKRKSIDTSPATTSPQLSVTSSSGGDFFTPLTKLKRQLSPSLTNLKGSLEDIPVQLTSSAEQSPQHMYIQSDTEQFDSWLKGVETTNEEDVKFVKKISEAIRDLDDALALEKTSSSSEASSKHGSPIKEQSLSEQHPPLDFRLGLISSLPQLDSLQDDHLGVRQDSSSDTEEETWRGRVERGEFSEKVKEKSRSVADLMILTHIENSEGSDESDSLPSLTRQYSIEKSRRLVHKGGNSLSTTMTAIGFGSEGNIRGAVLGEEFQESLKQLQNAWKIRDAESRNASLTFEDISRIPSQHTVTATKTDNKEVTFLGDEASEKELDKFSRSNVTELVCNLSSKNVNNSLTSHSKEKDVLEKGDSNLESFKLENKLRNDSSHEDVRIINNANEFNDDNEVQVLKVSVNLLPEVLEENKQESINKATGIDNRPKDLLPLENSSTLPICKANNESQFSPEESIENTLQFIQSESLHSELLLKENPEISVRENIDNKELSVEPDLNEKPEFDFKNLQNADCVSTDNIKLDVGSEDVVLKSPQENDIKFCDDFSPSPKEIMDEPLLDKDILNSVAESNSTSVQDLLDSKETSLSELESSSQSSEQVTTVVENDLVKTEENVVDFNLQTSDTLKNIPQIVVTEANELDMDNDADIENVCPSVEYKPRKFRILISDDTDTETDDVSSTDSEDNVLYVEIKQDKLENLPSILPITNKVKRCIENEGNFLEDFEISDIDLKKSFDSNSINIYNFKEKNCDVDKLKLSNVELNHDSDTVGNLNGLHVSPSNDCSSNNNVDMNQYSVILGSCEDYTLDYFKGLKTTNGKQFNCNDTEYSKNESNCNEESELDDTMERDDNINNWDRFLTNSLRERVIGEDSFRNVQFDHHHALDSLSSSQTDMTSEDTVIEDQNEDEVSLRLNKINLNFSEHGNVHSNDQIISNDYSDREDIIITENMDRNFNIYDEYTNKGKDIQMNEVKTRLENVAKFSEGFKLKSDGAGDDEEDEGKLLTPDDERSSDSGFRDKGSLSESVEDACDEKYNLEDIEAELEDAYSKKESKYFSLQDEMSSSSGEFCVQSNFPSNNYTLQCSSDNLTDLEEQISTDYKKDENESDIDNKLTESGLENEEVQCLSSLNELHEEKQSGGWYLHPPSSEVDTETGSSGWYPVPVVQDSNRDDTSYVSFHLDEEFVTAIRNELKEKLPCAQQQSVSRKDGEDDSASPEEERTDMVIEYGNYPVSLSPILEERESVSSNQSSIILDLQDSVETSGRSSPVLILERRNSITESSKNFEEEIKTALNLCKTDSLESEEAAIVVEDLEESRQLKIREEQQEEFDDLLIVDTETNEAKLLESPRPKSHLAFVNSQQRNDKSDFPETSPSINTDTFTPDSISPVSSRSSRTGVALSFSSTDTGNLSNFLSPSSLHSEFVDSGPPSLPFDLGETCCNEVERISIGPTNIAAEIIEDLHELGVTEDCDVSQSDSETPVTKLDLIDVLKRHEDMTRSDNNSDKVISENISTSSGGSSSSNSNNDNSINYSVDLLIPSLAEPKSSDSDKLSPNFSLDDLLISNDESFPKSDSNEILETTIGTKNLEDSEDWLKSVLLPLTKVSSDLIIESPKDIEHCLPVNVLPKESWPSCDELIPETVQVEKQIQEQEEPRKSMQNIEHSSETPAPETDKKCKTLDLNSTLALSSPNFPFGPDSNSSMVSSFSSTPTFDTTKSLADIQMSLSISSNDGEEPIKIVPSLRFLASEVLRVNKKVLMPLPSSSSSSSTLDDTVQSRRMNNLTLALDTTEVQSKAPMPSPEDADKGIWRPTINQLLDLTNQNDHDAEGDDLMTTSFIERDCDGDRYIPDWESDISDAESEDHSSSSGEFIWKPQDDVADKGMERIDEEDEEEEEDELADDSSCASATEFTPSTWDHGATPSKSALRTPDKKQDSLKRVSFKKQKYHCVYEYPREPSESEDDDFGSPTRRTWQTTDPPNYDCFADWDFGDCELETEAVDTDSQESSQQRGSKNKTVNNLHHPDVDIYRLSDFDYDLAQMTTDDGEFFISSSARPFHQLGSASEFFPGRLQQSLDQPLDSQSQLKVSDDCEPVSSSCQNFIENERKVVDEQLAVGGLRHTREWLKLDLPNPAGECTSANIGPVNVSSDPPNISSVDASDSATVSEQKILDESAVESNVENNTANNCNTLLSSDVVCNTATSVDKPISTTEKNMPVAESETDNVHKSDVAIETKSVEIINDKSCDLRKSESEK